jgi:hypothetical protein
MCVFLAVGPYLYVGVRVGNPGLPVACFRVPYLEPQLNREVLKCQLNEATETTKFIE